MTRRECFAAVAAPVLAPALLGQAKPSVRITTIPPAEDGNPNKTYLMEGTASGVDFRSHRVIAWAFAGGQWWVQPTAAAPKTPLNAETGSWRLDTHPGFQYAVMLVAADYRLPSATTPTEPQAGGEILAVDVVAGRTGGAKK